MTLKQLTLQDIKFRLNDIKKGATSPLLTNYFLAPLTGSTLMGIWDRSTVIFINDDTDFFRLYFASKDPDGLAALLRECSFPGTVVIDYVTKEPSQRVQQAFREAGFREHAEFVRFANHKLNVYEKDRFLEYGQPGDLERLWELLMLFDKYTDHFPTKATLLDLIEKRQVLVNRKLGVIMGYIVFRHVGVKANFNYFYNKSDDPRDTLMLVRNLYAVLHERGITSGILWVRSTNVRVRKLHSQFGWKEDGLKDYFYLKEKELSNERTH